MVCRQLRSFEIHIRGRERVLDPLVLPDRSIEYDSLARIGARAVQGGVAETQGFAGEEAALGVHAVEDDFETLAFVADEGVCWDDVIIEEYFVCVDGAAAHFLDLAELEARLGFVEVDEEEGEAFGGFADFFEGGGACEEDHSTGYLGGGNPDLLAGDLVGVSVADSLGAEFEGF